MLDEQALDAIADELREAARSRSTVPLIAPRHPGMTIEDSYAVQGRWAQRRVAEGRRVVGHKIGLTSRAMQQATGITEPDYGVVLDDMVLPSGSEIEHARFSSVRIEVELAFRLRAPLQGPGCTVDDVLAATAEVVPALEILDSRIALAGRTIVDTIADNAAMGAMVVGETGCAVGDVDLRWVGALLSRNGVIEESGVSGAVQGHPAVGVAWLADRLAGHGARLEAGELVLSGSFTRPVGIERGDEVVADYGPLGVVSCRFR